MNCLTFGGFAEGTSGANSALDVSELAFFGEKAVFLETFFLLGGCVLLTRDNSAPLVHH